MGPHAVVDTAAGHTPSGHLCWCYAGRAEFRPAAVAYLLDGLAAGQWIEYVGPGSAAELLEELAGYDADLDQALRAGRVAATPVEQFYAFRSGSDCVDPEAAVAARLGATHQALAEGYSGFRAVVDATTMTTTPAQRAAFVEFELLIDHVMSSQPVTALCGFDLDELGRAAVAELACLHPLTNLDPGFQLFTGEDGHLALTGTVDQQCTDLFTTALQPATGQAPGRDLVLDAHHLTAIDEQNLRSLNQLADQHDRKILLRRPPAGTLALLQHLDLPHINSQP